MKRMTAKTSSSKGIGKVKKPSNPATRFKRSLGGKMRARVGGKSR